MTTALLFILIVTLLGFYLTFIVKVGTKIADAGEGLFIIPWVCFMLSIPVAILAMFAGG